MPSNVLSLQVTQGLIKHPLVPRSSLSKSDINTQTHKGVCVCTHAYIRKNIRQIINSRYFWDTLLKSMDFFLRLTVVRMKAILTNGL